MAGEPPIRHADEGIVVIRKITADALRPGMYVHDLCCHWVDHPFLLNRFTLKDPADIEKILAAGITEVLIDTERGDDLPRAAPPGMRAAAQASPVAGAGAAAHETRRSRRRLGQVQDAAAPAVPANAQPTAPPATPALRNAEGAPRGKAATARMPAASPPANVEPATQAAPTAQVASTAAAPEAPAVSTQRTIADEFREARQVHAESTRVVRDMLADIRLGKQVNIERTHAVVTRMADAILRNPGPLLALCRLKQKDEYTFLHCVSVSALLMVFAGAAGRDADEIRDAGVGGLLHDVGKMKVPLDMLNKAGRLTANEMHSMRRHVEFGVEILRATPGVTPLALQIAAQHHERYDGSGYPLGVKGEAISRIGQMTSIVDVYDAMTSDRVYHRGITPAEALKQLLAGAGSHFGPEAVRLFIKTLGIYPTASLVMLESGRLAIVVDQSNGTLLQPRVRVVYDTRKAAFVTPFDVDLARTAGHGGEDRILRHESPQKWSIDPIAYLLEDVPTQARQSRSRTE